MGLDPPCFISRAVLDEELSFNTRASLNVPVYKDNGGITPPGNRTGTVCRIVDAMASTLGGAGPTLLYFARGTL